MGTVLLVIQIIVAIALIGLILIQQSEGGALSGLGGGGNQANNFLSVKSGANLLTRMTAVLATLFFILSLGLAWLSIHNASERKSIIDEIKISHSSLSTSNKPIGSSQKKANENESNNVEIPQVPNAQKNIFSNNSVEKTEQASSPSPEAKNTLPKVNSETEKANQASSPSPEAKNTLPKVNSETEKANQASSPSPEAKNTLPKVNSETEKTNQASSPSPEAKNTLPKVNSETEKTNQASLPEAKNTSQKINNELTSTEKSPNK